MRGVFFDRDGVLNEPVWDGLKLRAPIIIDEFKFVDGVKSINELKELGYKMFVVTNQPDIARGIIGFDTISKINNLIYKNLHIQEIAVCPHESKDGCFCRKPKPGMIINFAQKWDIDLSNSFMMGDMWRDIDAGKNAGCETILIDKPYNQGVRADHRVTDIVQAVDIIKRGYS